MRATTEVRDTIEIYHPATTEEVLSHPVPLE
jgi:hypothetical protein